MAHILIEKYNKNIETEHEINFSHLACGLTASQIYIA